ncbi:MAG: VWA domain-containing protein [Acidobacteria bacterium]|nr:VWA domain-containing protein [Acidobacteriota bacterium]
MSLLGIAAAVAVLWPAELKLEAMPARESAQFTSSVNLVEVYASVVEDGSGEPVRGLPQEDFEILEDGQPQTITAFSAGDFPLTAALALDASFSMAGPPLTRVKSAARAFLNALSPSDEAVTVGIGSEASVLASASTNKAAHLDAVDGLSAWGTTPLHDAIIASIAAVDASRGRRALVILSDGDDRYSDAAAADAVERARRSNVIVYPVALGTLRPPLFAELATLTGGRSFHAPGLSGLDGMLTMIVAQLREQYLLGYSPGRQPVAGSNEWRSITVRVKKPGVSIRARDGYYVR